MNSALGQLVHLRKSMSGHLPVLFMCYEYHFLDTINYEFLILDKFKFQHIIMDLATADSVVSPGELSDETFLLLKIKKYCKVKDNVKKGLFRLALGILLV